MITTRARPVWPGDAGIQRPESTGLPVPCLIRLKIFTLDRRLILKRIGDLSEDDRKTVTAHLRRYLL